MKENQRQLAAALLSLVPTEQAPVAVRKGMQLRRTVDPRAAVTEAMADALQRTMNAGEPKFASLPVPVAHRAAGAVKAWDKARQLAGEDGAALSVRLANRNSSPAFATSDAETLVRRYLATFPYFSESLQDGLISVAGHAAIIEAFWSRNGVLYEPTDALNQLLDISDVAESVPLGQLTIPAPVLCIVPPVSMRVDDALLNAVLVFEHRSPPDVEQEEPRLTFITFSQGKNEQGQHYFSCNEFFLRLSENTASKSIAEVVEDLADRTANKRQHWREALSYTVKVLLYLSLDQAQVIHDRPYSTAPRQFPGLGQRKRNERLAEIERLYDRYLIGPAVLPELSQSSSNNGESGHSVRPHWRRGHFRMQPFGPAASQRKLIFVMPVLVHADRLN